MAIIALPINLALQLDLPSPIHRAIRFGPPPVPVLSFLTYNRLKYFKDRSGFFFMYMSTTQQHQAHSKFYINGCWVEISSFFLFIQSVPILEEVRMGGDWEEQNPVVNSQGRRPCKFHEKKSV